MTTKKCRQHKWGSWGYADQFGEQVRVCKTKGCDRIQARKAFEVIRPSVKPSPEKP